MSRLALALGLALLAVEAAAAIYLVATSEHTSDTAVTLGLAVTGGVAFVISGLVAISRRPENRTGVYLAAVGYTWFFGALGSANDPWVYTIGLLVGPVVFGPLTALALVHPAGRFGSRFEAAVPWIVVGTLVGLATAVVLVDPAPDPTCDDCPGNTLNVVDAPGLGEALVTALAIVAIGLILLVGGLMVRRWRHASPALRRALRPVFIAIAVVLGTLLVDGILAEFVSQEGATAFSPIFFVAFIAVPLSFLYGILRTRLARSSASDLMVALERGILLREALADALGDPSLEIWYRLAGSPRWIDADGHSVPEPSPMPGRAQTTIERAGLPIAVLDYDGALAEDRELVDAVAAAAGLSLQNERLNAGLRAQYALLEALTDTAPSLLVNVGTDGRILNQNRAAVAVAGVDDEELVRGRFFWDVFIDQAERADVIARFQALAPDFPPAEYENTFTNERGEESVVYWRTAPVFADDGRVVSIIAGGLDITDRQRLAEEKEREREFLNAIANHAASLLCLVDERGVVADRATNIAFEQTLGYTTDETGGHVFWERYVAPEDAEAVRRLLEDVIAGGTIGEHDHHWVTGTGKRLVIAWTSRALPRIDERRLFLVSGVDVTERKRMEEEIRASRSRIVQAEDEARRRLERNLHDGAQQRLVALSVALRLVESKVADDPDAASSLLAGARDELAHALEELRELARGIHPAVLTDRGLGPALETLVGRAPLPVQLEIPRERLAAPFEAAAYYVVAESLTNIAKYGQASSARVSVTTTNGKLEVLVADDGVGGADPGRGSGLRGLADRVEALEGRLVVESPAGRGTTIRAEIPLHPARPAPG